jgi:hypothetical protein
MKLMRSTFFKKYVSLFLIINILGNMVFPTAAWALTSGPSQPEFQGFTPVGTSDMVNTFTGDFNYNIPLMDVGGYPLNIAYTAGGSMDEEASWVGFGWNLNPGSLSRALRGLPDDFAGDEIKKEMNFKTASEFELNYKRKYELVGYGIGSDNKKIQNSVKDEGTNYGFGFTYNNYTGYGFKMGGSYKNFDLSSSSAEGVGFDYNPKFSTCLSKGETKIPFVYHKEVFGSLTLGLSFNSRRGLNALSFKAGATDRLAHFSDASKNIDKDYLATSGYSYSFATPQYSPLISCPMVNASGSLEISFGQESVANYWANSFDFHFQTQALRKEGQSQYIKAYGYMNASAAGDNEDALHDFSREKDGSFATYVPHLPIPSANFDVFNFTAQGYGGNFRGRRNSIYQAKDRTQTNYGGGIDIGGIDFGLAADVKFGINVRLSQNNDKSNVWKDNDIYPTLTQTNTDQFYDESYFKMAGELIPENEMDYFEDFVNYEAIRVHLKNKFFTSIAENRIHGSWGEKDTPLPYKTKRDRRNQHVACLSAKDASKFGFQKEIEDYTGTTIDVVANKYSNVKKISRTEYPAHHNSEFKITKDDGTKYYYGLPVYNTTQVECTFSINGPTTHNPTQCNSQDWACDFSNDLNNGHEKDVRYTNYQPGEDSGNNTNGIDNYYEKTTTPPYAYSYLLTAIISPDYIDRTGDGPTDDDYGTYVKFNYQKLPQKFGWRAPYFGANYNSGLHSLGGSFGDDKASYTYGEKEIWYLHSIETKDQVAEFELSDRDDGYGAIQNQNKCPHEMGTTGINDAAYTRLKKLDKISLYNKLDRYSNALPQLVKTVVFKYNYSLCKRILNNHNSYSCVAPGGVEKNGKLSLSEIQITNGNSLLGQLSSYKFEYAQKRNATTETYTYDENLNPNYDLSSYDRWGNYKKKSSDASNSINPYCIQNNSEQANIYASVWNLSTVQLPSGGKIHIEYEADEYSFVQNKKVMNMMKMAGCTFGLPTASSTLYNQLYMPTGILPYLVFELPKTVQSKDEFKNTYLVDENNNPISSIYFKFFISITTDPSGNNEFVPGYLKSGTHYDINNSDNYGYFIKNGKSFGYLKINCIPIRDVLTIDCEQFIPLLNDKGGANPISQVAWNFTRSNLPRIAYSQPDPTDNGVFQILNSMYTSFVQMHSSNMLQSFNANLRGRNIAQIFEPESSFIRLYGGNSKVGGGYRVKRIVYDDTWQGEASSAPSVYGQEYSYTTIDEKTNKVISSGVASYEPLMGGEENPFRQPIFTEEKLYLSPNIEHLMEEPLGESYFPGAGVGYSKVTVQNINYTKTDLKRNNVGRMEFGFYTAKDYPTITKATDLESYRNRPPFSLVAMSFVATDILTGSEGFCIENNNMHGKPAYEKVYSYTDSEHPISSKEYYYKTENGYVKNVSNRLSNEVNIIDSKGQIKPGTIGVEFELVSDFRERENHVRSFSGKIDMDVISSLSAFLGSLYLGLKFQTTTFRSAVITKSITRSGILDSVVVRDLSSNISTRNLVYDEQSGQVLLTATKNEFEDPIYNFTYPAYWMYPALGGVADNHNIQVSIGTAISNPSQYFNVGDKVLLDPDGDMEIGWVSRLNPLSVTDLVGDGYFLKDYTQIRVLESGNKNTKNVSAGAVVSKQNPIVGSSLQFEKVIASSATEYGDRWKVDCNCGFGVGNAINPFLRGSRNFYRPYKSYAYLGGRSQSRVNNNLNIREDGIMIDFVPFWNLSSNGAWVPGVASNWVSTGEVTNYTPNGQELESVNPLGIYSSAVFGYGYKVPIIVASDARYREIGFENFEDYNYPGCKDRHFTFEEVIATLTQISRNQKQAHTGKSSLKISGANSVSLKKVIENCN